MFKRVSLRCASNLLTAMLLVSTGLLFLAFHPVSFNKEYIGDTLLNIVRVREQLNSTSSMEPLLITQPQRKRLQDARKTPTQQKLIILTYMRSGSSFTGALFGEHPEVFYVYEPLHHLKYASDTRKVLTSYLKKTTLNITESEETYRDKGEEIMRNFLNCDFESLDEGSLSQPHMLRSPTTLSYSSCLMMPWFQNDTYQNEMIKRIPGCISHLKERCEPANVTVLKVIEAKMSQVKSLISSDPRVKVIHLIRDPRGVLSSRRHFGKFNDQDPESFSRDMCNSVLEDISISRSLSQAFPMRILTVRYEDIVKEPIRVTKQLYRFVGLEMTPTLEKRIWEMTYAGLPDDCNICPVRSNSTETANGWRKGIWFRTVAKIQENCKTLFAVMGYRSFITKNEMRNLHIPTTLDEYDSRLMKVDARDESHGESHNFVGER